MAITLSNPTVSLGTSGPVSVAAGSVMTATVAGGPGNPADWLAVFAAAATSKPGNVKSWKWLSTDDTRSPPPATGVVAGTVHLAVPKTPGLYEVRFLWNQSYNVITKSAPITVVSAAPPPKPVPKSLTLTPPAISLPDSSPINTAVSTVAVTMSDGSAFSGSLAITPNSPAGLSGSNVVLIRALASADDGVYNLTIKATQNGFSASAALALTVTAAVAPPPPPTPTITVTPNAPQIPDTTPKGTVVATYSVAMSDGSPFTGAIGFGAPFFDSGGIFALSGAPAAGSIIVSPTGPGVGPNIGTITDHITLVATQ